MWPNYLAAETAEMQHLVAELLKRPDAEAAAVHAGTH